MTIFGHIMLFVFPVVFLAWPLLLFLFSISYYTRRLLSILYVFLFFPRYPAQSMCFCHSSGSDVLRSHVFFVAEVRHKEISMEYSTDISSMEIHGEFCGKFRWGSVDVRGEVLGFP